MFYCSSLLSMVAQRTKDYCEQNGSYLTVDYLESVLNDYARENSAYSPLLQELNFLICALPQPKIIECINTHPCLTYMNLLTKYKYDLRTFMDILQLTYAPYFNDRNGLLGVEYIARRLREEVDIWDNYDGEVANIIYDFCEYCESDAGNSAVTSDFISSLDNARASLGKPQPSTNNQLTTFNTLIIGYLLYKKMDSASYENFLALGDLLILSKNTTTPIVYSGETLEANGLTASEYATCFNFGEVLNTPLQDTIMEDIRTDYLNRYALCFEFLDHLLETSLNCTNCIRDLFIQIETTY